MTAVASHHAMGRPECFPPRSRVFPVFALLAVLACLFSAQPARASEASRASHVVEIEALLAYVAGLEGAAFLRNGSAHTSAEAAAHLRMKWQRQEERIRSAEDFIERCASRSFLTGKPYQVRLADGKVRAADALLGEKLKGMRSKPEG
jgi:hypothetical protein